MWFRSKAAQAAPTVSPVPLALWAQDRGSVEALREFLASPAFQKAAATLKELASPLATDLSHSQDRLALRHAWLTGYNDAFRDLVRLSKMTPEPVATDDATAAWSYIDHPQAPSL